MSHDQNGHTNGNGHTPKFGMVPAENPLYAKIVPAARRKVCLNTKITEAARMFFCYLTDVSLLPGVNSRPGVVKFSDSYLAYAFKVSDKTIRNWKRAIESTGEVWLTEKVMKNSFPQTVYNITAILGQAPLPFNADSEDGSLPDDEVFSSNRRRQQNTRREGGSGKFACRLHQVAGCPICRQLRRPPTPPTPEVSPEILQNQAENEADEKILPPATAIDCRPPRQSVTAHHGKILPSPTAIDFRGARQTVTGVGGKILPLSAANGFRGTRKKSADKGETQVGGIDQKSGGKGTATPPDDALERDFREWESKILADAHLSTLKKWEALFTSQLQTVRSEAARALVKRKLVAVRLRLHGPALPEKPAAVKPVRTTTATNGAKPMPPEERKRNWEAAKKLLSPQPVAAGA